MDFLGVLKVLLVLADTLASYLKQKQLLDAGAAQAVSANLRASLDAIAKAKAAVDAVRANPDGVRNDPFNDDNAKR